MSNIKSSGNWKSANSSSTAIAKSLGLETVLLFNTSVSAEEKKGSESHITSHYSEKVKSSAKASNIIHLINKTRVALALLYSATKMEIFFTCYGDLIFITKKVSLDAVSMFHLQ